MDRWRGKVAVVTGASSGIGEAIVKDLIKHGLIVVGLARRLEKMQTLKNQLPKNQQNNYHPINCDVSSETDVKKAFEWIEKNLKGVDILINNAGIAKKGQLVDPSSTESIKQTLDVNVMGIVYCTKEAFQSMKKRNVAGHVVLINSVFGHVVTKLPQLPPIFNIYPPSKFAVTAMTEVYRMEFKHHNTKVKITSISPGAVDTEIVPEDIKNSGISWPMLKSEDVSDAVLYVLGTPPNVQITELTIKPLDEEI